MSVQDPPAGAKGNRSDRPDRTISINQALRRSNSKFLRDPAGHDTRALHPPSSPPRLARQTERPSRRAPARAASFSRVLARLGA
jgi:hypothetical protein